jgi:hypothetical protein
MAWHYLMERSMKPELKTPCPCCGGPMSWCGDVATDDEPHGHDCDQITCTDCKYNVDFHSDDVRVADTFEGACFIVAARWNSRAPVSGVALGDGGKG